jgi:hypothetical protein
LHGAEYLSQRRFMELLAAIGPSAFRAIRRRITNR